MASPRDLSGMRFGWLTAISIDSDATSGTRKRVRWLCKCQCGRIKSILSECLVAGKVESCTCMRKVLSASRRALRGQSHLAEAKVWRQMISRCTKQHHKYFSYYGGRGITVCQRWMSFDNFICDMGRRPSGHHTLDRINNEGNYEPGNVRWATRLEQQNNLRNNIIIEYRGERLTAAAAARAVGIEPHIVTGRLRLGWTAVRALETPVIHRKKRNAHADDALALELNAA